MMNSVNKLNMDRTGFVDMEIDKSLNLVEEIARMKREKNVVILAHFYQEGEVQDIADFVGDSLGLSQQAAATDADIILFPGASIFAVSAIKWTPAKRIISASVAAACCESPKLSPTKSAISCTSASW